MYIYTYFTYDVLKANHTYKRIREQRISTHALISKLNTYTYWS